MSEAHFSFSNAVYIKGYLFYVTVCDVSSAFHKGIPCTLIIFLGQFTQGVVFYFLII